MSNIEVATLGVVPVLVRQAVNCGFGLLYGRQRLVGAIVRRVDDRTVGLGNEDAIDHGLRHLWQVGRRLEQDEGPAATAQSKLWLSPTQVLRSSREARNG